MYCTIYWECLVGGIFGKFGESLVICQTKTIQITSCNYNNLLAELFIFKLLLRRSLSIHFHQISMPPNFPAIRYSYKVVSIWETKDKVMTQHFSWVEFHQLCQVYSHQQINRQYCFSCCLGIKSFTMMNIRRS